MQHRLNEFVRLSHQCHDPSASLTYHRLGRLKQSKSQKRKRRGIVLFSVSAFKSKFKPCVFSMLFSFLFLICGWLLSHWNSFVLLTWMFMEFRVAHFCCCFILPSCCQYHATATFGICFSISFFHRYQRMGQMHNWEPLGLVQRICSHSRCCLLFR